VDWWDADKGYWLVVAVLVGCLALALAVLLVLVGIAQLAA